jgi:hypothetical protein
LHVSVELYTWSAVISMKKVLFVCQGILQYLIGLGAVVSGFMMIIKPGGDTLYLPLSMLQGSPFANFLIPGIILFTVNGIGNLFAGILSFRRHQLAGFAGIFFGLALMIWIFVQVNMIGGGHWLQYLYFTLGLVELVSGITIREVEKQWRLSEE